ncbi:MAG: GatB/YqeY domain-containing protein [Gemmatimonadota bacterium]
MSAVLERIRADQKEAMKAGDRIRLSTLRLLANDLHNRKIELGRDLSDDQAIEVLGRALKKRREAEEEYRKAGRQDRSDAEAAEAQVIQQYLPEALETAALDALIEEAITATGASSAKEMGRVMGYLMPRVKGRAEGGEVSRRVRERLS